MYRLAGRAILVTGAAQGMGRAMAIRAAKEGAASVTLADRLEELGEAAAEDVRQRGGKALFVRTDLTRPDYIANMGDAAVRGAGGQLDVLVNNAGVTEDGLTGSPQALETMSEETWDDLMDVNVKAIWRARLDRFS